LRPEILAILLLLPGGSATAAAAPRAKARPATLSSTVAGSATLAEVPDFSNTVYAAAYLRKHRHGKIGRAVLKTGDVMQRGVLKGYDLESKAQKWAKKKFFKPKPPVPIDRPLTGFEKPAEAKWDTGGYVNVGVSEDHATQGRYSLRAEFLLPADLGTPTGTAWLASMTLPSPARGPGAELPITDWTPFKSFRLDAWSAATGAVAFHIGIVDIRGFSYDTMRTVAPGTATTFEVSLAEPRGARLDLAQVASLTLGAETVGLPARPVLYLDNLRFELIPPRITSTVMVDLTLTVTGAVPPKGPSPKPAPKAKPPAAVPSSTVPAQPETLTK